MAYENEPNKLVLPHILKPDLDGTLVAAEGGNSLSILLLPAAAVPFGLVLLPLLGVEGNCLVGDTFVQGAFIEPE